MENNENSNLDDAANAVTTAAQTAQEVGKIGVLNRLFGPAADIVGKELATRVQEHLDSKQKENLEKIAALQDQPKLLEAPSLRASATQVGAFVEWIDGAKDVNAVTEPALAQAWSNALEDIRSQDYTLLTSLPQLDDEVVSDIQKGEIISKSTAQTISAAGLGKVIEPKRISRIDLKAALIFPFLIVFLGILKTLEVIFPSISGYYTVILVLASLTVTAILLNLKVFKSRDGKKRVGYGTLIVGEYGGQSYKWLEKDPQLVRVEKSLTGRTHVSRYYLVERTRS